MDKEFISWLLVLFSLSLSLSLSLSQFQRDKEIGNHMLNPLFLNVGSFFFFFFVTRSVQVSLHAPQLIFEPTEHPVSPIDR
jgi:hypothetical protein